MRRTEGKSRLKGNAMRLSIVTRFTYSVPALEAIIRAARGDRTSLDSWLNACRDAAREINHNVRFDLDKTSDLTDNEITAIFM